VESVPDGSIIIIPLTPPSEDDILNFTYLAREKSMFVKLHETLRERNTYGHIMSYSAGTSDKLYPVGRLARFATTTNFVIAKTRLVAAIISAAGAGAEVPTEISVPSEKRPRQLLELNFIFRAIDGSRRDYYTDLVLQTEFVSENIMRTGRYHCRG
jgi:hypothetical protein